MKAQLTQAAYLFNAPLAQTARVVDALRAKVEEQGPVTTDAPAADTTETTPEGGDEA